MSEQTKELHRTAGRLSITNDDYVAKMLHDAAETITAQQAAIGQLRDTLVIQMRCTKKDMAYIEEVEAENAKLKEDYNDLIYQVATNFPSESRHETAKRYIKQAEDRPSQCSAALQEDKQDGN